jgi:tRNA nucleotidyltransferase (CCA-adding enzyme)
VIESGRDWSVVDGDSSNTSGIGDNAVSSESFPDRIELGCDADEAVSLIRTLADAGFVAYLAGGCVRDALLGITPKDYDVATNATPQAVRKVFGKSRTLAFGASFGVIGVLPPNQQRENVHQQVTEVATFRSDGTYSDGRRPDSVHFGDPEQDALRRDFTINGLFYDPVDDRLIDFVGGRQDLRSGLLRTIGDPNDRFAEDRLRMLRAVRFAATLGFEIDPATRSAVVQHSRLWKWSVANGSVRRCADCLFRDSL